MKKSKEAEPSDELLSDTRMSGMSMKKAVKNELLLLTQKELR
nr:hypothetical protein [uncultured Ruminococcus sp.]